MLQGAFYAFVLLLLVLPALGMAVLVPLVRLTTWLWRSVPRWPSRQWRWAKALTIDPHPAGPFNDSRDVWPMPADE
ncbi:hypothetical protein ACIA5A_01170 [Micromonospora sp. NPDC051300]|uniref:hypothetical protein n=1 Tax=Micromonospora sp. NPDC051300 TaxID=3364286 RepID=UPI0037ABDBFA